MALKLLTNLLIQSFLLLSWFFYQFNNILIHFLPFLLFHFFFWWNCFCVSPLSSLIPVISLSLKVFGTKKIQTRWGIFFVLPWMRWKEMHVKLLVDNLLWKYFVSYQRKKVACTWYLVLWWHFLKFYLEYYDYLYFLVIFYKLSRMSLFKDCLYVDAGLSFAYQLLYLLDATGFYSLGLQVIGVHVCRATGQELVIF